MRRIFSSKRAQTGAFLPMRVRRCSLESVGFAVTFAVNEDAVKNACRLVRDGESRTQQGAFSGRLVAASTGFSGSWRVDFVQ